MDTIDIIADGTERSHIIHWFQQPGNEALNERRIALGAVSNRKAAWAIARQWIAIAATIAFCLWNGHAWAYLIGILVISTRQHALGILMHDATHRRLFTSPQVGDVLSDFFCAFPINMTTARYRYEHLLHHQYTSSELDPYWQAWSSDSHWYWPKTRMAAAWLFTRDLFGLNMHRMGKALLRWSGWHEHFRTKGPNAMTPGERCRFYAFWTVLLTALTVCGGWKTYFLLWALPGSTLTILWVRIRSVAEHLCLPRDNELNRSRHVTGSWWERFTIAPLGINYHIAHHLFPSIPHYNLSAFHRLLLQVPAYREQSSLCDTYLSFGKAAYRDLLLVPERNYQ